MMTKHNGIMNCWRKKILPGPPITDALAKKFLFEHPEVFDEFVLNHICSQHIWKHIEKKWKQKVENTSSERYAQECKIDEITKNIARENCCTSKQRQLYLMDIAKLTSSTIKADAWELYFPARNDLELFYLEKESVNLKMHETIERGRSVASLCAIESHALLIDDLSKDSRFAKEVEVGTEANIKSVICIPIVLPTNDLLAIVEFIRTGMAFSHADLQTASTVLCWMAACFHENNLKKVINAQQKLNDSLLSSTKVMFDEITSIDILVQNIMTSAKHLVGADRCALFLIDEERDQLFADYFDEGHDNYGNSAFIKKSQIRFSRGKGVAGFVARSGESVNIKDAYSEPRFNPDIDKETGYQTRNILSMPIISKSKIVGVVQMINSVAGDHFTNADEAAFKMFSVYCALALYYARIFSLLHIQQAQYKVAVDVLKYHLPEVEEEAQVLMQRPLLPKPNIPALFGDYAFDVKAQDEILPNLFIHMVKYVGSTDTFNIAKLCRFILTVRKNYRPVIYHNWQHGFAVAHSLWCMLRNSSGMFTPEEKIAFIIAGVCHDIDHRGYNNSFFQKMNLPLASMYSTSVMEQHHYRQTVTILQSVGHDIFSEFDPFEYKNILEMIRENIIATDLALYFINQKSIEQQLQNKSYNIADVGMRRQLRALMMTGADLAAICKPWEIQKAATDLIYEEFYMQGDEEKEQGIDPLPMMDRLNETEIPKQQLGFINFVCLPLYRTLVEILPGAKPLLDGCCSNQVEWQKLSDENEQSL